MGKEIGGDVYHAYNKATFKKTFAFLNIVYDKEINRVIKKCDVIKISKEHITFLEFEDFTRLNPVIKCWYKYKRIGAFYTTGLEYEKKIMNSKTNPLIIHRKEEMFGTYNFYEERKLHSEWTSFYENSKIPEFKQKSKIGRKKYWDSALELLKEKFPEKFSTFEKYL